MNVPWTESSTWNSLGGGVDIGSKAEAVADSNTGSLGKGTLSFDVTASVQAWANGSPNHGWVLVANGVDDWRPRSSDWVGLVERPMLIVEFAAVPIVNDVPSGSTGSRVILVLMVAMVGCAVRLRSRLA